MVTGVQTCALPISPAEVPILRKEIQLAAQQNVAAALDPARFDVEVVHLGQNKSRLADAERAGVKSVPALVLDGQAYHINFGAGIEVLK